MISEQLRNFNNDVNMHRVNANLDQLMKVYRSNGWIPTPPQRKEKRVTVEFKHRSEPGMYVVTCNWQPRTSPITAEVLNVDFLIQD